MWTCPLGLKRVLNAIVAKLVQTKIIKNFKERLVKINKLGDRGKLIIISTGSISEGVPCSMGVETSFRPLFRGGMFISSAMT